MVILTVILIWFLIEVASCTFCEEKSLIGYNSYYYTYCQYGCCGYRTYSPCCYSYYSSSVYTATLNIGAIVGIIIGVIILIAIVMTIVVCCVCVARKGQASAGQVINTGQQHPTVAYVNTTHTAGTTGQPQYAYGQGYNNAGYTPGTGVPISTGFGQPPPYGQPVPVQPPT